MNLHHPITDPAAQRVVNDLSAQIREVAAAARVLSGLFLTRASLERLAEGGVR